MATEYTKEYFRNMLKTDPAWIAKAILVLYDRQTADEQESQTTSHKNHMGFSGTDAQFLSSLARQIQGNVAKKVPLDRCLSAKQLAAAKKLMPKYAGQILEAALSKKAAAAPANNSVPVGHPDFRTIWPDEQRVDVGTMKKWAVDAFRNGDIDGPLDLPIDDLAEQMEAAGLFTLAHRQKNVDHGIQEEP